MGNLINVLGKRFGRLIVIEKAETVKRRAYWKCRCDCGNELILPAGSLLYGVTHSCGCLRRDKATIRATKHGHYGEALYGVWNMMKQRCANPKNKDYEYYGARGINVCEEWFVYLNFREWALSTGYGNGLTIDRKNPDRGYSPDNCRWLTIQAQQKNRRPRSLYKKD